MLPGVWARDDFFVQIAPGVDAAFVVAMIIAYKEMNETTDPATEFLKD